MSNISVPQSTPSAEAEQRNFQHDNITPSTTCSAQLPPTAPATSHPQPTPEQLYQYHLFLNTQRPYSPPCSPQSPSSSSSRRASSDDSHVSTSAVVETVIAIIAMIMMLVVAILGYRQMAEGMQHNKMPDMSGVIVALACIPIAVAFFTLLMKLAIRRSRQQEERDGQIALPDVHDLEDQRQHVQPRGMAARFWGGSQRQEEEAQGLIGAGDEPPPAYEERATQTTR